MSVALWGLFECAFRSHFGFKFAGTEAAAHAEAYAGADTALRARVAFIVGTVLCTVRVATC